MTLEASRQISHDRTGEGFARIRSKGDAALFGGKSTSAMKEQQGIPKTKPLTDVLPSVTIAAKALATEMSSLNVEKESPAT